MKKLLIALLFIFPLCVFAKDYTVDVHNDLSTAIILAYQNNSDNTKHFKITLLTGLGHINANQDKTFYFNVMKESDEQCADHPEAKLYFKTDGDAIGYSTFTLDPIIDSYSIYPTCPDFKLSQHAHKNNGQKDDVVALWSGKFHDDVYLIPA